MEPTSVPAARRASRLWIAVIVGGLAVAACGGPPTGEAAGPPGAGQLTATQIDVGPAAEQVPADAEAAAAGEADAEDAGEVDAEGTLAPPEGASDAFTYNPAVAPAGAQLAVTASATASSSTVQLDVTGLLPNRGYAAHVHQLPCGPTGAAAGPHHQHDVDPAASPEKPSSDPAFANPRNEIWLDLRTDGDGNAAVTAETPFVFSDRTPASVVIHQAEVTATGPGEAGTAGARVACLNVPFEHTVSE